jgi:hypothetical protein
MTVTRGAAVTRIIELMLVVKIPLLALIVILGLKVLYGEGEGGGGGGGRVLVVPGGGEAGGQVAPRSVEAVTTKAAAIFLFEHCDFFVRTIYSKKNVKGQIHDIFYLVEYIIGSIGC